MNLTLRTLLAYLDDMLDPEQTREIGQKISESEMAAELIGRIKRVTRRRHLTTPEAAGPSGGTPDANTVATYLDNSLPPDEIAEFERVCLQSDVQLAEVAACHQILTLVLGEPAEVPPLARQRMYELARGPEAAPVRKIRPPAPIEAGSAAPGPPQEPEEILFLGLPAYRLRGLWLRRLATAAAVLLLALGLAVVLYQVIDQRRARSGIAPSLVTQGPAETAPQPKPSPDMRPKPEEPPRLVQKPLSPPLALAAGQMGVLQGGMPIWSDTLVALPTMQANSFLFLNVGNEKPPPVKPPPVEPPAKPGRMMPLIRPPNTARSVVGLHSAATTRESLLFRKVSAADSPAGKDNDWRLVQPLRGQVFSGEPLVTLPAYRSEIALNSQVRLELVGNLIEIDVPVLEAAVQLHENPEVDLDLTLNRGRIVLTNLKPDRPALVRVRFQSQKEEQVWDIELLEAGAKVGLELSSRLERRNEAPWNPRVQLNIIATGGPSRFTRGASSEVVLPSKLMVWDSSTAPEFLKAQFALAAVPGWLNKDDKPAREVRTYLLPFHARLIEKISGAKAEEQISWVELACEEALGATSRLERKLGVLTMASLDRLRPVIAALDDPTRSDVREAAMAALFHWVGRAPAQDGQLRTTLQNESYPNDDVEAILRLLKGFDQPGAPAYQFLLTHLGHSRLGIRELAYFNLRELVPVAQRPVAFDPAGPADQRARAVDAWKARLLKK